MRYYVESDGRLYLVNRDGVLDLPHLEEIPYELREVAPLRADEETVFCVPRLDAHPREWVGKDEAPTRPDVSPRVRAAVHASMPRVVVEAVCRRGSDILLVKGARGLTEGRWTLPGGFLQFGESPEEGLLREIGEEIGAEGTIRSFLGVRTKLGKHTQLHWIMLFYDVRLDGEPKPNPDEISEVRYLRSSEAARRLDDPTMAALLAGLPETDS